MKSNRRIRYRKRMELGIIGALVICQVVFFLMRKLEFIPEIKEDNRPEESTIIAIKLKLPPKPKPIEPPPPPDPMPPKEVLLPKRGPIKPVLELKKELPFQPLPTASPEQEPFIVLDKEPKMIGGLQLKYPDQARRMEIQGNVHVEVLVDIDGFVADFRIVESSGYEILDKAAITSVKNSRWEPALQNDTPVSVWVKIPVKFELHR